MAYVLGFIFADGAIEDVQKYSRTCYIALTSKDKSIQIQIKDVLESQHKIYKKKAKLLTYPCGKKYMNKERYVLRMGSKTMYNDLLMLGVTPRKSLTVAFPKILSKYLSFFLREYFDGDGCIHLKNKKYPLVVFASGSFLFLMDLVKRYT